VFLRQPDPGGLHDRPRIEEACDRTLLDASSCEECAASSPWCLRASTCVGASLYGHTHARTTAPQRAMQSSRSAALPGRSDLPPLRAGGVPGSRPPWPPRRRRACSRSAAPEHRHRGCRRGGDGGRWGAAAMTHAPDVVIMDYLLPDEAGVAAAARIIAAQPHVRILLLTGSDDLGVLQAALAAGCIVRWPAGSRTRPSPRIHSSRPSSWRRSGACSHGADPTSRNRHGQRNSRRCDPRHRQGSVHERFLLILILFLFTWLRRVHRTPPCSLRPEIGPKWYSPANSAREAVQQRGHPANGAPE
jgi:CheY-like chemotaxis protein